MAADAGPCQDPVANCEVTAENEAAAEPKSPASPVQADAAANIGPGPAPANIRRRIDLRRQHRKIHHNHPVSRPHPPGFTALSGPNRSEAYEKAGRFGRAQVKSR